MATLAWHGDPALKAEVMARLRAHRADDTLVQAVYQRVDPQAAAGYRGCALGCTLPLQPLRPSPDCDCEMCRTCLEPQPADGDWSNEVERVYGIDHMVARLIDNLFEGLHTSRCGDFAVAVVDAIPVGADLAGVVDSIVRARYSTRYDLANFSRWDAAIQDDAARLVADLAAAPIGDGA